MGFLLKIFTGNPLMMVWVALAVFAAGVASGGATAWKLQGWRLGTELESAKRARDVYKDQAQVLGADVEACNAGVEQAKKKGDLAVGQVRAQLAELKKRHAGKVEEVARLEELLKNPTPAGAGCDKAWDAIEADQKARAAP